MAFTRHLLWAAVLRASLQLLDTSKLFDLFPGITTPVTEFRQIREGLWLQGNGYSPYHSPLVHTQPITLMLFGAVTNIPILPPVLAIAADLWSSFLINQITGGNWRQPSTSSLLYLWSPFSVLPCVATALSTFSCLWILFAINAAIRQQGYLAALCLAIATYLDLHPVLLLVPLALLLRNGMEDLNPVFELSNSKTAAPSDSSDTSQQLSQAKAAAGPGSDIQTTGNSNVVDHSAVGGSTLHGSTMDSHPADGSTIDSSTSPADGSTVDGPSSGAAEQQAEHTARAKQGGSSATLQGVSQEMVQEQQAQQAKQAERAKQHSRPVVPVASAGSVRECWLFVRAYGWWLLVLLLLSDVRLRGFPENQCLLPWVRRLEGWLTGTDLAGCELSGCWLWRSYGDIINISDLTPNIGLFWYFFMEIFTAFQAFFRLVFHSQVLALVAPFAIRFPHRPVLILVIFLMYIATFKPYPSMSDLALYQAMLPLLHAQFRFSKVALYMAALFAMLLVLIPAMWWQWLVVESANANFFYSVTLLLGAFHVLLSAHILSCSVKLDRVIAGKPVAGLTDASKS